ncbi:MAG: Rpn family recombination-promoting nuclease/putative transposase, partial [Deltaproteobacteria bacterium]|nr:Rpn family recombination-promoting nuclease/putative transposase [Deltaproteobacteria bacterium]
EINVLEIPKVRETDQSNLGNWMRFFAAKDKEDFEMLSQTSPAIAEAWGVIKHLSADESARMIAESREKARMDIESWVDGARQEGRQEGLQEGLHKGLQEGLQEGRQEGKIEVAQKLLRKKLSFEDIVDATGLPLEEIKQLAANTPE